MSTLPPAPTPLVLEKNKTKGWDDFVTLRRGPADDVNRLNIFLASTANNTLDSSPGCRPTPTPNIVLPSPAAAPSPEILESETEIADTGASHLYVTPNAPCANIDPRALQVVVGTAGGPPHRSAATVNVDLPLPVTTGYMMPNLHHNLMEIGPLCDHWCRVVFEKQRSPSSPRTAPSCCAAGVIPQYPICGASHSSPATTLQHHQTGDSKT